MSAEQDIQLLEDMVKRIEEYMSQGTWEPGKHKKVLALMDKADAVFDKIVTGYADVVKPKRSVILYSR